jgi:hypothetical protein
MIFWLGFAIYWNMRAYDAEAPYFFRFWGAPFLAVGLYVLVGRFFVDAWQRQRTIYGVTNDRVIVATEFFSRRTKSRQLNALPDLSLDERSDGSGSIDFGQMEPGSHNPNLSFRHLENCAAVCDIIVEARSRSWRQSL